MNQPLSIAFRPQSFESMVGSKKLIQLIRGHIESGRLPQAWLFSGETGCLVGDTLIDIPRDLEKYPDGIPIRDLVGTKPWVYSFDEKLKRIVLKRASRVWLSRKRAPVYRVIFSYYHDGVGRNSKGYRYTTELIGTGDHEVMLRKRGVNQKRYSSGNDWISNGYCRIDALKPGDRVMPFFRRILDDYKGISLNDGSIVREHLFILSELYGPRGSKWDGHHKDSKKLNNSVENLEWKTEKEHHSDHTKERGFYGSALWKDKGHPRGMLGKHQTKHHFDVVSVSSKERWEKRRKKHGITPESFKRMFWEEGLSIKEIAKKVKYNHNVVRSILKQYGLYPPSNNHTVVSVEFCGYEDVYDMTVPETHNFIANGVVVHNCGKTTVARILALSLQCPHQDGKGRFGTPCQLCQKNKTMYDIMEVNASEVSGVQDIGRIAESSLYAPRPPSRYRVFILDECFPKGTLLDVPDALGNKLRIPIEDISANDKILNAVGIDEVKSIWKRRVDGAVQIKIKSKIITSSKTHRYFTQRGWVEAKSLTVEDCLIETSEAMRILRGEYSNQASSLFEQSSPVLQQVMRSEISQARVDFCRETSSNPKGKYPQETSDFASSLSLVQEENNTNSLLADLHKLLQSEMLIKLPEQFLLYPKKSSVHCKEGSEDIPRDLCESNQEIYTDPLSETYGEIGISSQNPLPKLSDSYGIQAHSYDPPGREEKEVLLSEMRFNIYPSSRSCSTSASIRKDEKEQSDVQPPYNRESTTTTDRSSLSWDSRRQWKRSDETPAIIPFSFGERLDYGASSSNRKWETNSGIPTKLQIRHSQREEENWDRGRWESTQESLTGFTRSEERSETGFSRVESVEILESGDPRLDQFRDADGELYFYDIEAKRHPSFSVEGYLVHNCQRLSVESQNLLLKYFEDCPKTSIWIICTTLPQKILRTLRSRCVYYEIPGLKLDGIKALVERAIQFAKGSKPADPLVDALAEQGVWNPRFILQAVEKYLAGGSPEQSASVDSVEISVDTLKICRTLVNGNWQGLRVMLRVIPPDESRPVAQAIMGYLTTIILTSDTLQQRAASVEGIHRLSKLGFLDDGMRRPALMAILYDLTQMFSGKRQVVKSRVDDDGD